MQNPIHHNGICHQPGLRSGEKSLIRLESVRQGTAISIDSEDKKPSVSVVTRFLPIIQKPNNPMPSNAATAWNVTKNTSMLCDYLRLDKSMGTRLKQART